MTMALKTTIPETKETPLARAGRLDTDHIASTALQILDAAVHQEFRGRIALVSSFGTESAVLLHLAARVAPDIPVLFIDTGKHFAQTPIYRRELARKLGLKNIIDLKSDEDELSAQDPNGDLWRRDTDACCTLRKVRPLNAALKGYDAWITGRKQFHGGERLHLPAFEHKGDHFKVNPIVRWGRDDIETYFARYELPQHPLVEQGFASVGCWPCTHPVTTGEDIRSGRWRGKAKTECGIHNPG